MFQTAKTDLRPAPEGLSKSWPATGGWDAGGCWQDQPLARTIEGNGYSCWPADDWQSPPATLGAAGCTSRSKERIGEQLLTGQAQSFPEMWATANVPNRGPELKADKRPESGGEDLQTQSLCWPTMHGFGNNNNGPTGCELGNATTNWPTADTGESSSGHGRRGGTPGNGHQSGASLEKASEQWPTVSARDHKGINQHLATRGTLDQLPNAAEHFPSSPPPETTSQHGTPYSELIRLLCRLFGVETEAEFRAAKKSLNPRFAEWLMGWPKGWADPTSCVSSEMASWLRKQRWLLCCFIEGSHQEAEVA